MSQDFRVIQGTDTFSDSRGYLNALADALRTDFAGPTEPPNPVAYQTWADTTTGYVRERNAANDAWITLRRIGVTFGGALPLAGGTMEGAIAMGGFAITGLGLGSGTAAARQQEVDAKAPIASPAFTGDATINQDPAGATSLVRRSWAESRFVPLAGGTMSGPLVLPGNAAADLQAVPRQQVRDFAAFNVTTGHRHDGSDARRVDGSTIGSSGAPSSKFLRSNGSNASEWYSARRLILIPENQIIDRTAAQAWAQYDLASLIAGQVSDLGIYAVFLRLTIPEGVRVEFRPNAASAADQSWLTPSIVEDSPVLMVTTFVRVESFGSTYLHWRDVRSGTSEHMYIHVLGFLEA